MKQDGPGNQDRPDGGGLYARPSNPDHDTADAAVVPAPARAFPDIVIRRMTWLGGPGFWTYRPAVEAVIDIGVLEEQPSNTLPGFYERLTSWLPGLIEHRCSVGRRGGFLMRLRDGTWPGHIMEHVALELQTQAGMKIGFGKARMTHEYGVYKVVIRTDDEQVGRRALVAARDLVMAAINDRPFDVAGTIAELARLVNERTLEPGTASVVEAARLRGIPSIRLNEDNLVQLGHGAAQRRLWSGGSDATSAIAEGIARDWELSRQLLHAAGIPVPEASMVDSAEQAWEAARDIGLPVTLRPDRGPLGRGISLELSTEAEVKAAFAAAQAHDDDVMVERYVPGTGYCLLVVGNRVVAALRDEPVRVSGDGRSTVRELIAAQVNADPRRGPGPRQPLEQLRPDDPVLELLLGQQGLAVDSVLPLGQGAIVQRSGNLAVDVTSQVHPEIAALAAQATRVIGLDVAGVELVATDIGRPRAAQEDLAILAVNAGPALLPYLKPAQGRPQPVGAAIVEHLFPRGSQGRIPLVGLLSDGQSSLAARLTAALLQLHGWETALACRDGLFLGRRQLSSHGAIGFELGECMLINRKVEAAVLETTPRHILSEGLPYDRCQVGVVLGMPGPQGLSDLYITEADQMPGIVRTQVDVVLPDGVAVLNADDPQVLALAEYCDGEVVLFGCDPDNEALLAHRGRNGRAVLARDTRVFLVERGREQELAELSPPVLSALTDDGPQDARPQVLAAVAAAWALGVKPDLLRAGLLHFDGPRHTETVH